MQYNELVPVELTKQEVAESKEMIDAPEAYKEKLKALPEVQNLTNEIKIDFNNANGTGMSILQFGKKPAEEIEKMSNEILNYVKVPTDTEAAEMMKQLARVMNRFDIKEIEKINDIPKKESFFDKIRKRMMENLDAVIQKYDNMGKEVDRIGQLLRGFEQQTIDSNVTLTKMWKANQTYFCELEKYVVACDLAVDELTLYRSRVESDNETLSPDMKSIRLGQIDMAVNEIKKRQYDLLQAEMVARMTVPMLQNMQVTNMNLVREINAAFVVGLPIFKQNLAQAILLKRQAIVANSVGQFREALNTQLEQNANYSAKTGAEVAMRSMDGLFDMDTLRRVYQTVKEGTANVQRAMETQMLSNAENAKEIERMKLETRQGSLSVTKQYGK